VSIQRPRLLKERRGAILPLTAVGIVAICGMVALSVDLGMYAIARAQCQDAADAAAIAGARSLNASTGSNLALATTNATTVATKNTILGSPILQSDVSVRHGAYHYNYSSQTFYPVFPPGTNENYGLSEVTISHNYKTGFANVIGFPNLTVTAKSSAAYRPRDVALVIDFSGSMNNESDIWNCEPYLGSFQNTPNNTDPVFPKWGPYSPSFSPLATMQCTSSNTMVGKCNVTTPIGGFPALVDNLYQNARGSSAVGAFSGASSSITSTAPGGDQYLNKKSSSNPALTWQDITGSSATAFTGYAAQQGGTFYGYQQGPGYWGKTFFLWPPDPNAANDWRKKFFELTTGTALNDNTKLWNSSGQWNTPTGNYIINYKAILNWIVNTGPNPFPPVLRGGDVLYYSSIPTDVPASAYSWSALNSSITNADQRFWKEYIDYVIGVWKDPYGNANVPGTSSCSYGPDFTAGSATSGSGVKITGPDKAVAGGTWIAATDNPLRPRHRFWFGPMTMIQYMLDTGIMSSTGQDISMIAAKLGIQGALQDIQNNHPNDLVSMILYARPTYSGDPANIGSFTQPQVSLTNNYTNLINALWYPPNSSSSDVRPWDPNGMQAPRSHDDFDSNTATSYGLMLAYNQLSSSSTLQASSIGGFGRNGAAKLVVLETDGMANVSTSISTTNGGAYNSYYKTPPLGTLSVSSANPITDAVNVATNICALTTTSSPIPGFSTNRNPVTIECIAFGAIFESGSSGSYQANAVSLLQQVSTIGNTVFPSSASDPNNGYKWCIGTLSQRQASLQRAFTIAMDHETSIILVPNATN